MCVSKGKGTPPWLRRGHAHTVLGRWTEWQQVGDAKGGGTLLKVELLGFR